MTEELEKAARLPLGLKDTEERTKFVLLNSPHPRFVAWLNTLSPAQRAQIEAFDASLEGHPDIAWGHRHEKTARLTMVMKWCAANLGYEYSA